MVNTQRLGTKELGRWCVIRGLWKVLKGFPDDL